MCDCATIGCNGACSCGGNDHHEAVPMTQLKSDGPFIGDVPVKANNMGWTRQYAYSSGNARDKLIGIYDNAVRYAKDDYPENRGDMSYGIQYGSGDVVDDPRILGMSPPVFMGVAAIGITALLFVITLTRK